jgi:hypothetical protein
MLLSNFRDKNLVLFVFLKLGLTPWEGFVGCEHKGQWVQTETVSKAVPHQFHHRSEQ